MVKGTDKAYDREVRLNGLYLSIISRYRDHIEQSEHLSVAELPKLITPRSELVAKKAEEIKNGFGVYSYNSSFLEASVKAFAFVRDEIEDAVMPLEIWLLPDETMTFRLGDIVDRNTLLCSLLIAMGNPSSKVFVYSRGAARRVFTYHIFKEKIYTMEFGKEPQEYSSREKMLKSMKIDDDATVYEFDDKMYIDVA